MNLIQKHNDASIAYDDFKKEAIDSQLVIAELPLSKFELGRNETIKIDGKIMPTTDKAYSFFLKNILKVKPDFLKKFRSNTDEKSELQMLEMLRSGLSANKKEVVKVVANANTHKIESFLDKKTKLMTNENLLNLFELVMNKFPQLILKDFYLDKNNGSMSVNARQEQQVDIGIGENFNGGLSFSNALFSGTNVFTNVLRLICENGMIGNASIPVDFSFSNSGLKKMFDNIDELSKHNFIGENFKKQQQTKDSFVSSLYELEYVKNVLLNHSNLTNAQIDEFIPYEHAINDLKNKGIIAENLTTPQKKNCPIKMFSGWDLTNIMTDFGSHDYGYDSNYKAVQEQAAKFFIRHPDTANLVIF